MPNSWYLVVNLKRFLSSVEAELSEKSTGIEAHLVPGYIVTKSLGQYSKVFDTSINSFMPCKGLLHCSWIRVRDYLVRCSCGGIPTISFVSNNHLSRCKLFLHPQSVDIDIRPVSTLERSKHWDNVSSLDADTKLIPQSSRLELVRIPGLPCRKWFLLVNQTINSINSCLCCSVAIAALERTYSEPILPANLKEGNKKMRQEKATPPTPSDATTTNNGG